MIKYEYKKWLLKKNGLFILLAALLIKAITVAFTGYETDPLIEKNESIYLTYMEEYSGKLDDEKEAWIKEASSAITLAEANIANQLILLRNGEISPAEYEQNCSWYYEKTAEQNAFQILYSKYAYADASRADHYIIDHRGWQTLLTDESPDYILIFTIIAPCSILFGYEHQSAMNQILLTCRLGRKRTFFTKYGIAVTTTALISLLFSLVSYGYVLLTVGLADGSYPLQSLEFFEHSQYALTLWQAYALVLLLRMAGAVILAEFICLFSIVSRQTVTVLISGTVITLFPILFTGTDSLKYYLPFPAGLLCATGYIWPSVYQTGWDFNGELIRIYSFYEISSGSFLLLLLLYLCEAFLLLLTGLLLFLHQEKRTGRFLKKAVLPFSLFIAVLSCSSCTQYSSPADPAAYEQRTDSDYGETDQYYISRSEECILATAKDTGEEINLRREVFPTGYILTSIQVTDNTCYYMEADMADGNLYIHAIDLYTLQCVPVYDTFRKNTEDFYGLWNKEDIPDTSYAPGFFIAGQNLYILYTDEIVQVRLPDGTGTTIIKNMYSHEIIYLDDQLYYIDKKYNLHMYDTATGKDTVSADVYTDALTLTDGSISYHDLLSDRIIKR